MPEPKPAVVGPSAATPPRRLEVTEPVADPAGSRRPRGRHRPASSTRWQAAASGSAGSAHGSPPAPRCFALAAPQNQPDAGQIVDHRGGPRRRPERRRGDPGVPRRVRPRLRQRDHRPHPASRLGDAVRADQPRLRPPLVPFCPRFGLARKDLVEWAEAALDVPVEHIPVRIEDDAVRWDVPTRSSSPPRRSTAPDLIERLKQAPRATAPLHVHLPALRRDPREEVCARLAPTLAELYREEVDATGQPMSPEPLAAVKNAIEHYRVDDILISTLAGRAVEVARGGPDRPGRGAHRQAGRALRGGRRRAPSRRRGPGRRRRPRGESWWRAHRHRRQHAHTTARPRRTRARGSTARRWGSSCSSSPR